MRKKQEGKQKSWKKQNPTRSKGIARLPLIISAAIVIVILLVGFIVLRNRISLYNQPVSNPTPTASVVEKSKCIASSHPSTTPMPDINAIAWLEMPAKVKFGTTVPLVLRVKNISNKVITLPRENYPDYPVKHSLRITTLHGNEIWYWETPESNLDFLAYGKRLNPGDIELITGSWQQEDNGGDTVPPGDYLVVGKVSEFKTCPMTLTITNR